MIESILAIVILILYLILPFSTWRVIRMIPIEEIRVMVLNILLLVYVSIPFKAICGVKDGK